MNPISPASTKLIGLLSPGDMGQAVALRMKELGFEVCTALTGRSERTRKLAVEAGLTDCGDLGALLTRCDVLLSIVDPGSAMAIAREAAALLAGRSTPLLFADCNALAPQTKVGMQALIEAAGSRFVDASIIGPPPRGAGSIRIYVSGSHAEALTGLQHESMTVKIVSPRVGDAAAVKMCYGAVTKGTVALLTELQIAARRLGVEGVLDEELAASQPAIRDWILRFLPSMPPKAYRWVPETEEIASTFAAVGLTPLTMQGAARMCEAIAKTSVGAESPEEARARKRSGKDVIAALDKDLP